MPYKNPEKQRKAKAEWARKHRMRLKEHLLSLSACKVTIKDMKDAIKQMESEGYTDVKVVSCPYWQRFGKEAKPE